jgi:hypothetical protein
MSAAVATVVELHPNALHPAPIGPGDVLVEALRWYARGPHPGAHIQWTIVGPVLLAVSTPHVYVWIDGVRLLHVRRDTWLDRWGAPAQHRPGNGILIAALSPRHGLLVRSGREHHVVLDGVLVPIDPRVYRHLLRERSAT